MADFPTTAGKFVIRIRNSGGDVTEILTGNPIASFLETKDLDFGDRAAQKYVDVIMAEITDAEQIGNVDVNVGHRDSLDDEITWEGPFALSELAEALFVRFTDRYVRLRIASDSVGVFWRLGSMEIFGRTHGRRF